MSARQGFRAEAEGIKPSNIEISLFFSYSLNPKPGMEAVALLLSSPTLCMVRMVGLQVMAPQLDTYGHHRRNPVCTHDIPQQKRYFT